MEVLEVLEALEAVQIIVICLNQYQDQDRNLLLKEVEDHYV
jgi:hypothetical protein